MTCINKVKHSMRTKLYALLLGTFFSLISHAEQGVFVDRIVFGQSADFSATRASLSQAYSDGAQLYFDQVNRQGGVHGRRIEIKRLDDGYQVKTALENTQKLIHEEKVFALIHYVGTAITEAVIPLADKEKIPFLNPITGANQVRMPDRFSRQVFHLRASYADEIERIVSQLKVVGIERIGLVYEDEAFGKTIRQLVLKSMDKNQLKLAVEGVIPFNNPDKVADAVRAIQQKEPQAIIVGNIGPSAVNFFKAYESAGQKAMYFTVSVANVEKLYQGLGESARGIVISQVMPSITKATIPIVKEYLRDLANSPGATKPSSLGIEGYLSARLIVESLQRCGKSLSQEKFITMLESMGRHEIGGFAVNYSATNHNGSSFVDLGIIGLGGKLIY